MDIVVTEIPGFRIIRQLGSSLHTDVWLAEQESLARFVTIKVLREAFASDPAEHERFVSEAKTMSVLNHPRIIQIFNVGEHEGVPYLVTEYVSGPSIGSIMEGEEAFAVSDAIQIVTDVAEALSFAWEQHNCVHCNITPKCIYLDDDNGQQVKLAYLGMSLRVGTLGLGERFRSGEIEGTPYYMAPEQATAPDSVDCRTDIYSLGATLYHMITGKVPFGDRNSVDAMRGQIDGHITHPKRYVRDLPPGGVRLLERMLMKDPERRYADWSETLTALRTCLTSKTTYLRKGNLEGCTLAPPKPVPPTPQTRAGQKRNPKDKEVAVVEQYDDDTLDESVPTSMPSEPMLDDVDSWSEPRPGLRQRLLERERVVGSWIQIGHGASGEILSGAGFDWLAADMEHTDIDLAAFTQVARGVYGRGPEMWARVRENDTLAIRQVLDAGAQAVIVPLVNSAEEAHHAVSAARFPPEGVRGFSFSRMNDWGANFDDYAAIANESIAVIVMIESEAACDAIEEIMAVDGVDGAFIGPYDLSGSLGLPGQTGHPRVQEACERVVAGCVAAGKSAGIHIVQPDAEAIDRAVSQGFNLIALGMDTVFLADGARRALAALHSA
jgi:2-keto-3-deoxy-L-rhamnonate aldolase RhmA/serine/threonine protein kinase